MARNFATWKIFNVDFAQGVNLVLKSYLVVRTWFSHNNLFSLLFLFALSDISVSPDLRNPVAMLVQESCAMGILLKRTQVERRASL